MERIEHDETSIGDEYDLQIFICYNTIKDNTEFNHTIVFRVNGLLMRIDKRKSYLQISSSIT